MLPAGANLGAYEIVATLGKGGMGEVYLARDTKLNRDVAIKILPQDLAHDPERVGRFQREAEALAALNHPNIAGIHDVQQDGRIRFLVLEFVDGDTLADTLTARGALPVEEALQIARQICDALEAAHDKGIVHRDLKPANLKIMRDGVVKVLDFGLAKALDRTPSDAALSNSPTLTLAATGAGIILGTAAYMSPEQARGRTVDRRADIFAFGCVLYEMLVGRPAFQGDDVTEILGRVVTAEPDLTRLPATTPASIRRLLRRALAKDPRQRLSDIRDARIEIEESRTDAAAPMPPPAAQSMRLPWIASLAVSVLLIAALALPALRHLRESPPPEYRTDINTPATTAPLEFALSPDGRLIVFVASGDGPPRLWVRALDKTDTRVLPGTDGAALPFWSTDSRSIAFFAGSKLYRVDIAGGQPQVLSNAAVPRGGSWSADGTVLFAASTTSPLLRIPASGGEPTAVTRIDPPRQTGHRLPRFLPDARHFLFYATGSAESSGIYLGSLDGGEPRRLTAADSAGEYLRPDRLVFVRQGVLLMQQLDVARGEVRGDPVTLAIPVGFSTVQFVGGFSVSDAGLVAYRANRAERRQLMWYDRAGKPMGAVGEPDGNNLLHPQLSPDDRRLAVTRTVQNNQGVWLRDLVRGSMTPFTFDAANDYSSVWSPDGTRVAFTSNRKGPYNLYVKSSGGASAEEVLLETPDVKVPQDWSRDGRFLLYYEVKTARDLWALEMTGKERSKRIVANTQADERHGQFSPDGRLVAYATNESGRFEVLVQTFPGADVKLQVSASGGSQPRWRVDGRELYYLANDGKLMAVPITPSGKGFTADKPTPLFGTRIDDLGNTTGATGVHQYAVSRDGRFLINQSAEDAPPPPITLLLNWKPDPK